MIRKLFLTTLGLSLALSLPQATSWGRGFGGGFGGGHSFGGGGLGGGGLGGGGFGGGHSLGGGGLGGDHSFGGLGGGGLGAGGALGGGGGRGLGSLGGGGLGGGGLGGALGGGGAHGLGGGDLRGGPGSGLGSGLGGGGLDRGGLGQGGARGPAGLGGGGLGSQGLGGNRFSSPSRSQLNSFLGLPSDEGLHNLSSTNVNNINRTTNINANVNRTNVNNVSRPDAFDVNRGSVEGPRGGYAAGATVTGPRGNTVGGGAAVGPHGGTAAARGFEGAGGAAGIRGAAVGPGGRVAAGGAVRGPRGGAAAGGAIVGPHGAAAGFARVSPTGRYTSAVAVRGNFSHWNVYGAGWYTAHPGAWFAAGWATGAAWRAATWGSVGAWMAYYPPAPIYYDYGNTVTYEDNSVYVNGQDVGTSEQYYQQAVDLAADGAQSGAPSDGDWMPLGVFALAKSGESKSNVTIQLAVNKQGVIRGNYTDSATNQTQLVQGSVDKQTQRVAFTVGDNKADVVETGLYNLTKDEAPCLIHFGQDRTEQWLLVRLKKPGDGGAIAD